MTFQLGALVFAVGLNAGAAVAAMVRRSVSRSGAVAGTVVGSAILYFGGLFIWGMLMLFFVSSSVMSRVGRSAKTSLSAMHEKGDERDAMQVIANGGAGLIGTLLFAATGNPAFAAAAAGGFAAANADTWASELGVLSPASPRSIISGRTVAAGASGGVTRAGTIASIGGGALIALWFALWSWAGAGAAEGSGLAAPPAPLLLLVVVAAAGALGSVLDSILGATVQALYRTGDGDLTERRQGPSGEHRLVRGWTQMTNDAVNLLCTFAGAGLAGAAAAAAMALGWTA